MVSHSNSGKSIQSVQRAIDILNCFTSVDTALSLGDISVNGSHSIRPLYTVF